MKKKILPIVVLLGAVGFGPRAVTAEPFNVPKIVVEAPEYDQPKPEGLERYLTFSNPHSRGEAIRLTVETREEAVYEVYNLVGKLVWRARPELKDGRQYIEIPTDEWQSGIYFMKASTSKATVVKRFVIS
ncbi:MAG: T9SS type A sorting domain-containing protein [Bacteroidia bacterium]|nr:T9SS type A sorting domain-containing protein [Bacteroidia bacterium]MDW8332882.1 T9SS type A sorting domain-containing protein [Bacteroidia bacterium]